MSLTEKLVLSAIFKGKKDTKTISRFVHRSEGYVRKVLYKLFKRGVLIRRKVGHHYKYIIGNEKKAKNIILSGNKKKRKK